MHIHCGTSPSRLHFSLLRSFQLRSIIFLFFVRDNKLLKLLFGCIKPWAGQLYPFFWVPYVRPPHPSVCSGVEKGGGFILIGHVGVPIAATLRVILCSIKDKKSGEQCRLRVLNWRVLTLDVEKVFPGRICSFGFRWAITLTDVRYVDADL